MRSGRSVGSNDIPIKVWKCLVEVAIDFLPSLFTRILETDKSLMSGRKGFWC